jgi:hypothetical protein
MLNRQHLADIYRPQGPKAIQTGIAWTPGGSFPLNQVIDLSLPIRGLRFRWSGRIVVGTAGMTTPNPEGPLNVLSSIIWQGTNARQQGNLTLWNIDSATAFVLPHLHSPRGASYMTINSGSGETIIASPSTPFGATYNPFGTTGTYDVKIVFDLPSHPFQTNAFGKEPLVVPQFLIRNEEWKDSLQVLLQFGNQAGGGATGMFGVSAAGTTFTFTAYGSASGNPTVDIYTLPVLMGTTLKDQILPGVISRVATPLTGILQNAGNNVSLLNMQKQPTPRVYLKSGTSTVVPAFATLSDTNVSTLGVTLGGNRNVRNVVDVFVHKMQQCDVYNRDPIQGYAVMDFIEQGNPDASYPGQDIGDGSTFALTGTVAGTTNGFGVVVQEQILQQPAGALMNF